MGCYDIQFIGMNALTMRNGHATRSDVMRHVLFAHNIQNEQTRSLSRVLNMQGKQFYAHRVNRLLII